MDKSLLWRGLVILAIIAAFAFSAFPLKDKINLGLDLRGGVHLELEVQTDDALGAETQKDIERVLEELRDAGVTTAAAADEETNSFVVRGVPQDKQEVVDTAVEEFLPSWNFRQADRDLSFQRKNEAIDDIREKAVRQALQTVRTRIDAFGVAEPIIQRRLGSNRIVVQLPGVDDPQRVIELLKSTAFLEFRLVHDLAGGTSQPAVAPTAAQLLSLYGGTLPDDVELFSQTLRDSFGEAVGEQFYGLEKRQVITGRDLKDARPSIGEFNDAVVQFNLTPDGARRFGDVTGSSINRRLAIVLDGEVRSAPNINSRITDSGIIQGGFTQVEVEDLSLTLRSGALPARMKVLSQTSVGPTLGQASIDQGFRAGMIGAGFVVLAMFFVYKGTGFNAIVALSLNFVLVFGALAYFGAALTLPGLAGIVLIIGMAVDANVLVFERIREELRNGRTVKAAVNSGFAKALSSVLDANITTLIAAMFLFNFGTGPVRGFAVTLSVGILASVFTAIIISRFMFDTLLSRRGRIEKLSI